MTKKQYYVLPLLYLILFVGSNTVYSQVKLPVKKDLTQDTLGFRFGGKMFFKPANKKGKIKSIMINEYGTSDIENMEGVHIAAFRYFAIRETSKKNINIVLDGNIITTDKGQETVLIIYNPNTKKELKFNAMISAGGEFKETEILPVKPGQNGIELWPYKLESILIYDLRFE